MSSKRPTKTEGRQSPSRVLVTRPAHQADALVQLIESTGASALRFPVLEIQPAAIDSKARQALEKISETDMLIFISPNAVTYGLQAITRFGVSLPEDIDIAAVGQGTVREFRARGLEPTIAPQDHFNSESLLALPAMQNVQGKRVLILRGNGGREVLRDTLLTRGAEAEYVEVYERRCPEPTIDIGAALRDHGVDIIIFSSGEGARNLVQMTPVAEHALLFSVPLIVISPRIADICRKLGFTGDIAVSRNASDAAVLDALQKALHVAREE